MTNYWLPALDYLETPSSRKADASQKRTRDGLACNQMLQLSYSNKTDLYGAKKYVTGREPGSVPSPGLCLLRLLVACFTLGTRSPAGGAGVSCRKPNKGPAPSWLTVYTDKKSTLTGGALRQGFVPELNKRLVLSSQPVYTDKK